MFNSTDTYKQRLVVRIKELIREEGRSVTRQSSAFNRVISIIETNDLPKVVSTEKTNRKTN